MLTIKLFLPLFYFSLLLPFYTLNASFHPYQNGCPTVLVLHNKYTFSKHISHVFENLSDLLL